VNRLQLLSGLLWLVRPGSVVVVELEAASSFVETPLVRLEHAEQTSSWFRWTHVTLHGVALIAECAGMRLRDLVRRRPLLRDADHG